MKIKLPESILVTTSEELIETVNNNKRKSVILFLDEMPVFVGNARIRWLESRRALKNRIRLITNRKVKKIELYINREYSEKKGLI